MVTNAGQELKLQCKHCKSFYISLVFDNKQTGIKTFSCRSCRKRCFYTTKEIANLRRQATIEVKKKTTTRVAAKLADTSIKVAPPASQMFANDDVHTLDDLFEYQQEDVDKFIELAKENFENSDPRVLFNFNKMGLGKTPHAIAFAEKMKKVRILVLCSKNTMLNWKKEIWQWVQEEAAITHPETYYKFEDWKSKILDRWFITNVETVRNREWARFVLNWRFDYVIYDEAHSMRNVDSAAKAREAFNFLKEWLKEINQLKLDGHLMLMTGSPIVNDAADLYPHFALAYPKIIDTRAGFINRFCTTSWGYKQAKVTGFISPKVIKSMIDAKGVQHTKEEKLKGLPTKTYNIIRLEMGAKQRELYDDVVSGIGIELENGARIETPSILEQFIRMRQICVDPELIGADGDSAKLDFLEEEFLDEIGDEPFVIFSTFETKLADKIEAIMKRKGKRIGFITGKVSSEKRFENIQKFQNGELDVIFATIQAGSEGVTLTRASHVLLLDRWWTPASNEQAVDRLHRIGQTKSVTVHWLQLQDAFDVYLDAVIREKMQIADSVRTGEVVTTSSVQKEVLRRMFNRDEIVRDL